MKHYLFRPEDEAFPHAPRQWDLERAQREMMNLPARLRVYNPDGKPRQTDEERQAAALERVRRAFIRDDATEEESLPYRIRCAWRIVRQLAMIRGWDDTTPLIEILQPTRTNPDPWQIPEPLEELSRADYHRMRPCSARVHKMLSHASLVPDRFQPLKWQNSDEEFPKGLAYSPPRTPEGWVDEEYGRDHTNHRLMKLWVDILETIGQDLGLENGTPYEPDLGRLGFVTLVNPDTAMAMWPSWQFLVMWEDTLAERTLEKMIQGAKGAKGTYTSVRTEFLRREHGLTLQESNAMMKLAHRIARDQVDMDLEDVRAVSVLRLENALERAKNAMDLRNEIQIHKQLAIIQGLNKSEPQDEEAEFLAAVRKADEKAKALRKKHEPLTLDVRPTIIRPGPPGS